MKKIAGFVYDHAKLVIVFVILLNLVSLASFFRFNLDADFLSFFSEGNPKADEYHALNEKYDSGEMISLLIESDASLLEQQSLLDIYDLEQSVSGIEGVTLVQTFIPTTMPSAAGTQSIDASVIENNYQAVSTFIADKYFMTGQFLNEDHTSAIVAVNLAVDADSEQIIEALKDLSATGPVSFSLAGNPVIKDTIWSYLVTILLILPPCALILVFLVFFFILRNIRLTILSIIPAGFAALWTFGTIFWSGRELNLLTVLTPLFILVMGSAYGLHYVSHFLDNMGRHKDRRELTVDTLSMVGKPIFLATITTMAGFGSLVWTDIIPMRSMGIFVTIGIAYAGFIALFFLPAVVSRLKLPEKPNRSGSTWLNTLVLKASGYRWPVIIVFAAIIVVSAVAIPGLTVDSDQLAYFKENSEIRQTSAKIEKDFGSAVPLTAEIAAPLGQAAITDADYAGRVLTLEREMEQLPGVKSVFSPFDMISAINYMMTGQSTYPTSPQIIQTMLSQVGSGDLSSWVSSDGIKVVIKTASLSSDDIATIESFVDQHDEFTIVTGMPVLSSELNKMVVRSQFQSLGLAMVLIFIMLWISLRKITAALSGIVPIAITIVAILGMLSLTDFNLNMMTANLSAIAIGVGVDYSIHLLSSVYYYRSRGSGKQESITEALTSVSRPVLANAFGLAIGFSAMFFSPLRIHIQAASVMWVAMVVSSMAALLLVPQFYGRKRQKAPMDRDKSRPASA